MVRISFFTTDAVDYNANDFSEKTLKESIDKLCLKAKNRERALSITSQILKISNFIIGITGILLSILVSTTHFIDIVPLLIVRIFAIIGTSANVIFVFINLTPRLRNYENSIDLCNEIIQNLEMKKKLIRKAKEKVVRDFLIYLSLYSKSLHNQWIPFFLKKKFFYDI